MKKPMMYSLKILAIFLLGSGSFAIDANTPIEEEHKAVLIKAIKHLKLPLKHAFPACFGMEINASSANYTDFEIHELSGGNCLGDPDVSPPWAFFRVDKDHNIFWYNTSKDSYEPFNAFAKRFKK